MSTFRKTLFPTLLLRGLLYGSTLLFLLFTAGLLSYFFLQLSAILLVLIAFYLYIIWTLMMERIRLTFVLFKIFVAEKSNKDQALKLLESEIYDHKELLGAEKSEMDSHRLNTRNEGDAMRYSNRGERDYRASLALLQNLHQILIDSMKETPSLYDIDLDDY